MAKKQRVIIDDDSGEPKCLMGNLDDPSEVEKNVREYVKVAIDELKLFPNESRTLTLTVQEMGNTEVEALPEL